MKLVIITGMSGAGKHTAFKCMEDMGYNCVDNLPVPLLKSFAQLSWENEKENDKVAVGIDIRSGDSIATIEETLNDLAADGKEVTIVFLDADDDVLIADESKLKEIYKISDSELENLSVEDIIIDRITKLIVDY